MSNGHQSSSRPSSIGQASSSQFFSNNSTSTMASNARRDSSFSIPSPGGKSAGGLGGSSRSGLNRPGHERTLSMFKKYIRPLSQPTMEEDAAGETEGQRRRREKRHSTLQNILQSRPYKIVLVTLSIILMTGAQIRDLWLPKDADVAVDVIFCLMIAFFLADMGMRIDSEPNYFHFSLPCSICPSRNYGMTSKNTMSVGSFVFWCELVSTIALLQNISWTSPSSFHGEEFYITLDDEGIPTSELAELNESVPFERDLDLLVVIAKAARAARVIRSGEAVKLASAIPWYAIWSLPRRLLRSLFGETTEKPESKSYLEMEGRGSGSVSSALSASRSNRQQELMDDTLPLNRHRWYWPFSRKNGEPKPADPLPEPEVSHKEDVFEEEVNRQTMMGDATHPELVPNTSSALGAGQHVDSKKHRRSELKVGSAMRELTGQRVAIGIICSLALTALFTYVEENTIRPATMLVLHNQTSISRFREKALEAARSSVVSDMFLYEFSDGTVQSFSLPSGQNPDLLRERETVRIRITDANGGRTSALFDSRGQRRSDAVVSLLSTLFILLVWFFGVTAFAGPVMILVVIPIERMVRLLGMLMLDPLGYQGTSRYRQFVAEENEITRNTRWTQEVLKGMETSFLMSNILRIGSLMRVGFGSAGVEIIRNNLETGQNENMLILDSEGLPVSCIFLFCDIRQFTDATECLREEVFVFTNRIAAVVHSFCHSYGGSANKNVGDAFLISWLLDEGEDENSLADYDTGVQGRRDDETFSARHNQADKALWSVVKICISLYYDDFYLSNMSPTAREALLATLSKRSGPVVQMGFGLHAGRAVQGAIGSQRKIDATYVSEAVERAELLESSTKKYGLQMLMSDSFHRLLHPNSRRRCRKVDQLLIKNDDDEEDDDEDDYMSGDKMEIFTFDMDISALFRGGNSIGVGLSGRSDAGNDSDAESGGDQQKVTRKVSRRQSRRLSARQLDIEDRSERELRPGTGPSEDKDKRLAPSELVLPTGSAVYNANNWTSDEIRRIRALYTDGLFFHTFSSGLQAFYSKDWDTARSSFAAILERFEDGPSKYFLDVIMKNDGVPPKDFREFGIA